MSGSSGDPNSHIHKHTYTSTHTNDAPALSHGCLNMVLHQADVCGEDFTVLTLTLSPLRKLLGQNMGVLSCDSRVQSSGMVLACLVWCGEQLLHHSLYPRLFQFYHWKSVLQSPKTSFGVPAENPIISLTLTDIAGACNKPEVSAFAMLFETRIELALPCKLV